MKRILTILFFASIISCNPDPDPKENCELINVYKIGYNAANAPAVYDISKSPPIEIRNGKIEYNLVTQEVIINMLQNKYPYPLNEYAIDSIEVLDSNKALVHFSNDLPREYEIVKMDCKLEMNSATDSIPGELKNGGKEISLSRYVIYEHKFNKYKQDSFHFIEFRNALNKNYFEIIKEFAKAYPGKYDTIAIEEIINSTREY